jgi:predicted TIM-barrel fold metal-dependent hydrolase
MGKSASINRSLSEDGLLKLREKHGIENMTVMSLEQDINSNNEKLASICKRHRFVRGLVWVQKSQLHKDIRMIERGLGEDIIGAKFHGSFENAPVSSAQYAPLMEMLNDRQAVLLVHTGRYKDAAPESNTSYLHALQVARTHPKIRVVMAHMGGSDTSVVKRALVDSKDVPNVYFDTSGITTPYAIEYALSVIDARRILFGSDEPWCSFMSMYYNVADAQIDEKHKSMILHDNYTTAIMT